MKTNRTVVIDCAERSTQVPAPRNPDFFDYARYPELRDRYANDLCAFAKEVCGVVLNPQARQAFLHASKPAGRMVTSETSNVEAAMLAPVALWAMLFHKHHDVAVIAPRRSLFEKHRAIYVRLLTGPHGWVGEYLRFRLDGVQSVNRYFGPRISFRCASNHAPENIAGMYGPRMFFVVEASGLLNGQCRQVLMASIGPELSSLLALPGYIVVQTTDQPA